MPISVFTVMEISSLNENEELLEDIYREQLDAIIFSINQYSGDLFSVYTNQVEIEWARSGNTSLVDSVFFNQNFAVYGIAVKKKEEYLTTNLPLSQPYLKTHFLDSILEANESLIERITRYKQANYAKPEPLGSIQMNGQLLNVIMVIIGKESPALFFINPILFVEDLLGPKIQEIATQNIDISVKYLPSDSIIYQNGDEFVGIVQSRNLWLLPEYEIGVSLRGQSVEELIAYRTRKNIISLVLLILLIVFGFILVIRNLKREMLLSKTKSDFVANVSHEIRTPLSLISMFNETLMLGRVKDEAKKKEYYEIISKETSRLKNIVNKILSFSQIDADKKSYHFVEISPNEEIKEVWNSYSYHLENKGFEYFLELEESNTTIKADKEAFVEIIINLIDNAIKYSKDTKHLLLKSYTKENHFVVEVQDKGIGIESNKKAHVFEKFYRVTGGDLHDSKGTGLGLSLVAGIMDAHGGKVVLDSKLGKGSTFKLIFPINGN
jgi:two-component system phosphate regulon sensor histidine kinase PhoR